MSFGIQNTLHKAVRYILRKKMFEIILMQAVPSLKLMTRYFKADQLKK